MKDQYVGDINDYRKYALLRALSSGGANRIGVCWMLTPSDGGMDGGKLAYMQQPERHRHVDPELFDILAHAAPAPDRRRLETIENSGAIPGALYHNDLLPDDLTARHAFMGHCAYAFRDVDLIFFDPDNGLEVSSLPKGRRKSSKYLYLDEVAAFYASGKSLLIYQHFTRRRLLNGLYVGIAPVFTARRTCHSLAPIAFAASLKVSSFSGVAPEAQ